jgi:hypothetical protein
MNKTTSIALKIFALYLIFSVLVSLPSIVASSWGIANINHATPAPTLYAAMIILPTGLLAAIAIWLLWKTANSIAPKQEAQPFESTPVDLEKLYQYAIALMGFYFAVNSLLSLPSQWLSVKMSVDTGAGSSYLISFETTIVQLILGCFLIAKPKQWVKWLKSIGNN